MRTSKALKTKKTKSSSVASEIVVSVFLPIIGYLLYFSSSTKAATTELVIGILFLIITKIREPILFRAFVLGDIKDSDAPWVSAFISTALAGVVSFNRGEQFMLTGGMSVGIFILMLLSGYESWAKWLTLSIAAPILLPLAFFNKKPSRHIPKKPLIIGSSEDGWNLSPGLETHPITLVCGEATAQKLKIALSEKSDELFALYGAEKIEWKELEQVLERNRSYFHENEEIEHLHDFDAKLLYQRDPTESAKLLRNYFESVANGYSQLKFIKDLAVSLDDEELKRWECGVDGVKEVCTCAKCNRFSMKKYPIGQIPIPPFHFGCRCSISAKLKSVREHKV